MQLPGPPAHGAGSADRVTNPASGGFALVEVLIVISLIGIAAAAAVTVVQATTGHARHASRLGRQATVAVRVASQARAGLEPADSVTSRLVIMGEAFEATMVRRDSLLPGAIEIRVVADGDRPVLVFETPRLDP